MRVIVESLDAVKMASHNEFNLFCGTVAALDLDNFGRMAEHKGSLVKIGILRDDDKPILLCTFPYQSVVLLLHAQILNVQ